MDGAPPRTRFEPPEAWPGSPQQRLVPAPGEALADPERALRAALAAPVGRPPLEELAAGSRRVAVVLPDSTRPTTPWRPMLAAVLDALFAAGRSAEDVVLVIGNGMHPPRGPEALGLDGQAARGCPIVDHDALDRGQLARVGRAAGPGLGFYAASLARLARDSARHAPASAAAMLQAVARADGHRLRGALLRLPLLRPILAGLAASGAVVRMNRVVAEADLVVGLSRVKPHPLTGYSGGAKSIYPATGDRLGVGRNHLLQVHPDSRPGEVEHNRLRQGLEAAVARLACPFVVNVVTDGSGRWCAVNAGDPVASHRAILATARLVAEVPAKPTDVVIFSNSESAGLDLYQFSKSFVQPARLLRPGGTAIGVASLPLGAQGAGPQGVNAAFGQGVYYVMGIRPLLARGVRLLLVAPDAPRVAHGTPFEGHASLASAWSALAPGPGTHVTHLPDVDSLLAFPM